MKNRLLFCAWALCLLACTGACQKQVETGVTLSVSARVPVSSRVTDASEARESRISDIQVFVFDGEELEAYGSSSDASVTLRCRLGEKTVWVLANAPALGSVVRISDLEGTLPRLTDNAPDHLVMAGRVPLTVQSDRSVSVTVERLCAKVSVAKITKSFTSAVLQAKTLVIHKIYMTNVVSGRTLSDPAPLAWSNRMGDQGECPDLLCDTVSKEVVSSLDELHTFYVYPNGSTSAARGGTWSPRPTRLVISASLDDVPCYYVIDIPGIEANYSYFLSEVILSRPGSDDEESVTSESAVRFSFRVTDWASQDPYFEYL